VSDFHDVRGFDQVWRPPAGGRKIVAKGSVLGGPTSQAGEAEAKAKLARVVEKAPEVMVKITGKTKDGEHLGAHLDYISRKGELDLEQSDGAFVHGRDAVKELALDWAASGESDSRRRANSTMSVSIVLSMPVGTDPERMKDAVRAFARAEFGETFPYVFAFHQDAKGEQPHVHLSVRSLGIGGERLNPKKADLADWRERFARELRGEGSRRKRRRDVREGSPRSRNGRPCEKPASGSSGRARTSRVCFAKRDGRPRVSRGMAARPSRGTRPCASVRRRCGRPIARAAKVLAASTDPKDQALGRSVEAS
jgi:hypothetical protein